MVRITELRGQFLLTFFEGVGDVFQEDQAQHHVLVDKRRQVGAQLVSYGPGFFSRSLKNCCSAGFIERFRLDGLPRLALARRLALFAAIMHSGTACWVDGGIPTEQGLGPRRVSANTRASPSITRQKSSKRMILCPVGKSGTDHATSTCTLWNAGQRQLGLWRSAAADDRTTAVRSAQTEQPLRPNHPMLAACQIS